MNIPSRARAISARLLLFREPFCHPLPRIGVRASTAALNRKEEENAMKVKSNVKAGGPINKGS